MLLWAAGLRGNVPTANGALLTPAITHLTPPVTPQVNTRWQGPRASSSLELPLSTTARRSHHCHKGTEFIPLTPWCCLADRGQADVGPQKTHSTVD